MITKSGQKMCLGTWFGGRPMLDEDITRVIDGALACGIRCFDTSPHYGHGRVEALLGSWITRSGLRDIQLMSKVYLPSSCLKASRSQAIEAIRASVDRSSDQLRLDSLHCVLVETGERGGDHTWIAECLLNLIESGRTAYIALHWPSRLLVTSLLAALSAEIWQRVQVQAFFNSVVAESMRIDLAFYHALGLEISVYGILCGGALSPGRRLHRYARVSLEAHGVHVNAEEKDGIANVRGLPMFAGGILEATRAVRREPAIRTVILGATNLNQLTDLTAAFELAILP